MAVFAPFIPYLVEGAVATGEVVGEAVGSEAVGNAVSGGIIGKAGELLDKGVAIGVDAVFGKDAYENFEKDLHRNFDDAMNVGLLQQGSFSEQQIVENILKRNKDHQELAKDISNFANDVATHSIGDSIPNVLEKLKRVNPVYYYLANKMLDITHDLVLPTNDEYKKVASVYNGSVFFKNDVKSRRTASGIEFYGITERGEITWKYPEYNNYTVISPLWGTWTGINSPNDAVPVYGLYGGRLKQSQLDKIAFIHDCLYKNYGSFNQFADYVLISYIDAGIDQGIFVFPNELETSKIARTYFSTLGVVVRKIYGDDVSKGLINDLYSTVYNVELSNEHIGELRGLFIEEFKSASEGTSGSSGDACPISKTSPQEQELLDVINSLSFEID